MLFSVPDIFLSVTAVANIGLLWFVYEREKQSEMNRLFALFVMFITFWALVILLFRLAAPGPFALWLLKLSYIAALLLAAFFHRFSLIFPHAEGPRTQYERAIIIGVGLLSFYLLLPGTLTLSIVIHDWGKEVILEPYAFTIFATAFLFLFGGAIIRLAERSFFASGAERIQLAVIAGTVGVIGTFGIYFNLVLPSPVYKNFQYIWTGPVFTFIFAVVMLYSIFRYRFFNPRAIIAELLVYTLLTFIFVRLLLTTTFSDQLIEGMLLAVSAAVGSLVIRGVHREVEQREEIQKLAGDLEVANRQQESLIHFISHEVKGALGKCSGILSFILEGDYGPVSERLQDAAQHGLSHTREAAEMLTTILLSANLKSGAMKFDIKPFSFKKAAEDIVDSLRSDIEAKHLVLKLDLPAGDCTVNGDESMLATHVIKNLIDNAIRYTPQGNITIRLEESANWVTLAVKDSGVGLTDEDKSRLFTAGGRGKDSVKVNVSSTGYGLFFAKQLVEEHKGTISADSEGRNKGSTFTVILPRATI